MTGGSMGRDGLSAAAPLLCILIFLLQLSLDVRAADGTEQRCTDWLLQDHAASASTNGGAQLHNGRCLLHRPAHDSPAASGLIGTESNPPSTAVWLVGPRTAELHLPWRSDLPSYFPYLNCSGAICPPERPNSNAAAAATIARFNQLLSSPPPQNATAARGRRSSSVTRGGVSPASIAQKVVLEVIDALLRFGSYPWLRISAVEQLFLRRCITLRFDMSDATYIDDEGNGGHQNADDDDMVQAAISRQQRFSDGSLSRLRLISFPPVVDDAAAVGSTAYYRCALNPIGEAIDLERKANRHQEEMEYRHRSSAAAPWTPWSFVSQRLLLLLPRYHRATAASPMVYAAGEYASLVREELGPYQETFSPFVPPAISQALGRRLLNTRTGLVVSDEAETIPDLSPPLSSNQKERLHRRVFHFTWTADLPAALPVCLAATSLPTSPTVTELYISESLQFDVEWLYLLVATWILAQLQKRVEQSRMARFLVTGCCGTLLLLLFACLYAIRQLQQMTIGKLGLLVALAVGGTAAVTEGFLNVLWHLYLDHGGGSVLQGGSRRGSRSSTGSSIPLWLMAGVLLCTTVSSLLLHLLLPASYLRTGTRWSVRLMLALLLSFAALRNRSATSVALLCYHFLFRPRLLLRLLLFASRGSAVEVFSNDPVEHFPPVAKRAVSYAVPLAETHGYAPLPSATARFRKYEEDGAAFTRQALEDLATHLRQNPGLYATRLRDPNGLQRWAGDHEEEEAEE